MSEEEGEDRTGIWRRRRLLDGSLNRVPPMFYTKMWSLLEKCQGLLVQGRSLPQSVTQEMTSGEMKFHLVIGRFLGVARGAHLVALRRRAASRGSESEQRLRTQWS